MKKSIKIIISYVMVLGLAATNTGMFNANAYDDVAVGKKLAKEIGIQIDSDESARELTDLSLINAREMPDIILDEDNAIKQINGLVSDVTVDSVKDVKEVIQNVSNLFGIDNVDNEIQFNRLDSSLYNDTYDFIQYYDGVKVENAHIKVVVDKDTKKAHFLNNSYVSDLSLDTTPVISGDDAEEIVFNTYNTEASEDTKLVIFEDQEASEYKLAWHVSTKSCEPCNVYINAADGSIIYAEMNTEDYDEVPTTYTSYQNPLLLNPQNPILNSTSFKVDISKEDTKYILHDTKRNIYMLNIHTDCTQIAPFMAVSTTTPSASSNYAHLATLYNVEKTYDFYSKLNWKGINNQNSNICVIAEYDPEENGSFPNAMSDGNVLYFGVGGLVEGKGCKATQNWGTELDIVAHEYTHSVTRNKVNFDCYGLGNGEARVLNEAYSDIMAEFIDETPEWQHGTDQYINNINKNTCDPKQYQTRDIAGSTLKYTDSGFSDLEFHKKSVVISRAAYLMDQFGISREDNARIWFTSLDYLTPNATFADCRTALVNAALQVAKYWTYGERMDCMYKVKTAFNAVGVMDPTDKIGDVDLNGTVNSADFNLLVDYCIGNTKFTAPVQKYLSDVNFDNKLDISDLVLLKSMIS